MQHQFNHIKKLDHQEGARVIARLLPGEYYISSSQEVITTVLGSCISVCMFDPYLCVGGINHFMLPIGTDKSSWCVTEASRSSRYGNYAMENLINGLMSLGAQRQRLEIKVFGGAKILDAATGIGSDNIRFVRSFLRSEGLRILSEDTGAEFPRKVNYYPDTGKVRVKRLRELYSKDIARREQIFGQRVASTNAAGDIEFF